MTISKSGILAKETWDGRLLLDDWTASSDGSTYDVIDKATGDKLASVGLAKPADVARAAKRAAEVQAEWVKVPLIERAEVFRKAARLIEDNRDELAEWIMQETGAIRPKADMELSNAAGILLESASLITGPQGLLLPSDSGQTSMARRIPLGVVGTISPFNFPLILSIRGVAPALATGNGVVLKPDPQTAVAGGVIIARILEEAGLPKGLFSLLPGGADAGAAMCEDPNINMIAFTGSTPAGRKVGEAAGRNLKRVSLELGGKNSLVILEDADMELALSNAAFGSWMHQGQICMSAGRTLVHESIYDEFVEALAKKAAGTPVGDPMSGTVALGPMINKTQVERIHGIVQDSVKQGVKLHAGGEYDGLFYQPTVLSGAKPGTRAFDEEFFGPVASVIPFSTDDEAVELATDTEYGLSAAVISKNVPRALELGKRLKTGLLHINNQTVDDQPWIPFGGTGASGNGSRAGGPADLDEFTQMQWVTIREEPPAYPF